MFTPSKQPDLSKIRLPKAASAPRMPEIQFIYNQAQTNVGREVELFWTEADERKMYCINAKFEPSMPDPTWTLWEDDGNETKLVWRFETSDFELINDVVNMLHKQNAAPSDSGLPAAPVAPPQQPQVSSGPSAGPFGPRTLASSQRSGAFPSPTSNSGVFQAPTASGNSGVFNSPPPSGQNSGVFKAPTASGQNSGVFRAPTAPNNANQNTANTSTGNFQPGYFQENKPPVNRTGEYQPGYFENQNQTGSHQTGRQTGNYQIESSPAPQNPSASATGMTAQQRPRTTGFVPPFSPAAKIDAENPYATLQQPSDSFQGSLEEYSVAVLLQNISQQRMTGKLEILGEDAVGDVFFENGVPKHAGTPSEYGDGAVKELVTWEKGSFIFKPNVRTEMKSVENHLANMIQEGTQLLDQKRHLKKAGLRYESILVRRHKNLTETELRLMLSKGAPLDFDFQRDIYNYLRHKRSFTDLLRDKPMDSTAWSTVLFNLLSCGLIEIKPPDAIRGSALDFLGEAHSHVQAIAHSFTRVETGIYSFPALMYFMEYEFNRFEAYNYPMSLIVFEMQHRRNNSLVLDLLNPQACSVAAMRIDLVKRKLDVLGHFETVSFALLLPNTTASSAAFVANRINEALTATPLTQGVDKENLALAFGVASLPSDGETLENLVYAAKTALSQAKLGTFPIVLARTPKRE